MTKWYKILVLGSSGVGKTCCALQFVKNRFVENYNPSLGSRFSKLIYIDDVTTFLSITDTTRVGEHWDLYFKQLIQESCGFLMVYSIDSRKSFDEVEENYNRILQIKQTDSIPCVIIGNKCDLEENQREILFDEGIYLAKQLNCIFLETSAKDRYNSDECFIP